MKRTTIIGTAIAAVGLAACGSTAVTPPTAPSTLALTVTPNVAPTVAPPTAPTAVPTVAPTAKPKPCGEVWDGGKLPVVTCGTLGIYVTTTCSRYPGTAQQGGTVTFHGVKAGDWMGMGSDPEDMKFPVVTYGPVDVGRWAWDVWSDPKVTFVAMGTLTIREC
jgi:hypothetical protein